MALSVVTLEDFPRFLIMITRVLGWLATTTIWTEIFQKDNTSLHNNRYLEGILFVNLNARHSTQTTRFTDVHEPSQWSLMARYPHERVNLMSCYSSNLRVDKTYMLTIEKCAVFLFHSFWFGLLLLARRADAIENCEEQNSRAKSLRGGGGGDRSALRISVSLDGQSSALSARGTTRNVHVP